jgi:putative SOS response-associated peptidase YedK
MAKNADSTGAVRSLGGMCGRYTSTSTVADLASVFEVDEVRAEPMEPRYNVAPTLPVYAVALTRPRDGEDSSPRRALGTFRWGLVPSWAKDPSVGNRMINARSEGITEKPAYRRAVARRRCLIPADAFYEWQRRHGRDGRPAGKLPYVIRRRDGRPMALAGIWEFWRADPDAEPLRSCAIVTTAANALLAPIHDRMPVILEKADWAAWLDPGTDMSVIEGLMVPAPEGVLEAYPVSTGVNDVAHDGPELIEPLPDPPAAAEVG